MEDCVAVTVPEVLGFDVVVVGGGPVGLSAAIRIRQLAAAQGQNVTVSILEMGSSHIRCGAVIDPIALTDLLPNWEETSASFATPVTDARLLFLTETKSYAVPNLLMRTSRKNQRHYIVSPAQLCRFLRQEAQSLGVEIYPDFAAADILYDESDRVVGVTTGDMSVTRDGNHTPGFKPQLELRANLTLLAEDVGGSLTKQVMARYGLPSRRDPRKHGLAIEELWHIDPAVHQVGLVEHSQGWPLARNAGGSFVYHLNGTQIALGLVVHLNYDKPYLSPFDEFQRLKTHPAIARYLKGGDRITHDAHVINEGQLVTKQMFPGGAVIGCATGFANLTPIKGGRNALRTGALAGEAAFDTVVRRPAPAFIPPAYQSATRSHATPALSLQSVV
jgi:electron-transferring-flavoprotein dehydrogenase